MKQHEALSLLKMGENIFLTGAAGAGKTYLLNQYIHYLRSNSVGVAITASTGIAATHLNGVTLHAWSGIGVKDYLTQKDLEKLSENRRVKSNYKKTKVLIIDEISMLHAHQLDMVDVIARFLLQRDQAFGGIQVIVCGDFFQLPPVSSGEREKETRFAFESLVWESGEFQVCYLEEQHRQINDPLLTVLNDIRTGTAGEHTKVPLRTRYKKEPQGCTKPTKLYARNMNVDHINNQELANLAGQERIYVMQTVGFSALVEGLKKNCLALEQLKLKIGSEVMFIKNDLQFRYANGTRGVVVGFEKNADALPVIRTYDNRIITANREEWKYEENGVVRAVLTQVPLRLAWAITIHKSQGMTLDAAEMDLGDTFEPGMGYVALSRVRSLNGLKLMNLNEMALKVHPKILIQDQVFKNNSAQFVAYWQNLSDEKKAENHQQTLLKRFEGCYEKTAASPGSSRKKADEIPTHTITFNLLKEGCLPEIIAEKRGVKISTIIHHLEKLQGLNQLDDKDLLPLKNRMSEQDFETIFSALKQSEDGKLRPIYEKFEGKYSYENIHIVRLFLR